MKYHYLYRTDKGCVRVSNQDSFIVKSIKVGDKMALLAAVCDGVGGLECGDKTSRKAVELLGKWADYELVQILSQTDYAELMPRRFGQMIQAVNKEIYYENLSLGRLSGTTLTAIVIYGSYYIMGHVGDSRIYKIDDAVHQLTTDHSWISQEVAAGRITQEEAEHDLRRNVILQCIGVDAEVCPELKSGTIVADCLFVLCTDGFWHQLKKEEWMKYFSRQKNSQTGLEQNLKYLFELVKKRGEEDNLTAVVIGVDV